MNRYFALLSGENTSLAMTEIESLIRLLDYKIRIEPMGRFLILYCDADPIPFLLDRAALLKQAGKVISSNDLSDEVEDISLDELVDHIEIGQSFSVKSISLMPDRMIDLRNTLIKNLGAKIKRLSRGTVNLDRPDIVFTIFLVENRVIVCTTIQSTLKRSLELRNPGTQKFFHPSMMNAKLSRIMCNLAGIMPNDTVLDPFCGAGGILSEAMILGANCVGIDLNWSLLRGAFTNLSSHSKKSFSLLQGDARSAPLSQRVLDAVVTDPPYGRTSSTRGEHVLSLIQQTLESLQNMLHDDSRICISGSSEMKVVNIVQEVGFKIVTCNEIYVHSGLTREVISATL